MEMPSGTIKQYLVTKVLSKLIQRAINIDDLITLSKVISVHWKESKRQIQVNMHLNYSKKSHFELTSFSHIFEMFYIPNQSDYH